MIGFLAKDEDRRMNDEGQSKLSLQRFPGPYKYPMMQAFLHAFASAIQCARLLSFHMIPNFVVMSQGVLNCSATAHCWYL